MADYRVYCFDGAGRMESAEIIQAENDTEALAVAWTMNKAINCEVWDQNRFVGRLPASRVRA